MSSRLILTHFFSLYLYLSPALSLMEKAYALRDRRETERRKYVSDMYEERWREECDDVRDLDGKALSVFMATERQKQVAEKIVRDKENAESENAYYAAWEKQLEQMAALDDQKKAKAKDNNIKTFEGLKEQIAQREASKQAHYDNAMAEAEVEIAEVNAAIVADKDMERRKKLDEINRGKEVLEFNAKYKDIAAEKAKTEAEHDKLLLDHALELERARIASEKEKAKAGADAAKQYRAYLQEMMIKEAEDNGEVDEVNRREAEKIWKARDDALQARQDARDYLMKLVNEGRAEQIAYKEKMAEQEKDEGRKFAQKFMTDIAEGVARDRADADARRQKNIDNLGKLQEQIDERAHGGVLSQQEKFLDNKRMQHIENLHRQKLANQGGKVKTFYPKKKPDILR